MWSHAMNGPLRLLSRLEKGAKVDLENINELEDRVTEIHQSE